MADFCNQCAKDLGFPEGDLKSAPGREGKFAVLCEGCGWIVVDESGNCQHIGCHETQVTCKLST